MEPPNWHDNYEYCDYSPVTDTQWSTNVCSE